MEKIVPLAAPSVKGPLGVAHMPRLWLKGVLGAAGLLPEGYRTSYDGSNQIVIDGLGLDPEATIAYVATRPAYADFENWVREKAKRLDAASIAAVNAGIAAQQKPKDNAADVRARVGVTDTSIGGSALLNAMDDWALLHADVVAHRGKPFPRTVPAVSSQSSGPLGLMHLPRFWTKATLTSAGALWESWMSGRPSGFDMWFTGAIGLDIDAAIAHVHAELPTYMEFETWAVANAKDFTPARIPELNEAMHARLKPAEVAAGECATLGIDTPGYRPSIELNDRMDWHTIHAQIAAHTAA